MKNYNPRKIADATYLASNGWKCEKSPTGAHFWVGDHADMECKYCEATKKTQDSIKVTRWTR